jgi:hypothetical protein
MHKLFANGNFLRLKTGTAGGAQEDGRVEGGRWEPFIIDVDIRVLLEAPIELCELLSEPFIPLFAVGFETT